jgi:hypothetical protein
MKVSALAFLAPALLGSTLLAQDPGTPSRPRAASQTSTPGYGYGTGSNGYLPGTGYSGGICSGYGGTWWGGGCRPGFIAGYPGFGTIWGGTGGYYGSGTGYAPWGEDGYFGRSSYPAASAAGPVTPAIDRSPQATSAREIEEGRRRFRTGDYHGAVDSFRSAVVATTESPVAQAWFSVSLIAAGEGRNADKAIRAAALGGLPPGSLSLDGLFKDDKERVRLIVSLAKVGPEGGLAAAYALSLAGEPVRLKQLAEKDPAARLLLPKP